jgi:ribosomal protein L14E/L6E/L27E
MKRMLTEKILDTATLDELEAMKIDLKRKHDIARFENEYSEANTMYTAEVAADLLQVQKKIDEKNREKLFFDYAAINL